MNPYWIEVAGQRGVGLTAHSAADAIQLFEAAFGHRPAELIRIGDIEELDHEHVVPNMGDWQQRGIWFPRGYEHISP